MGKERGGGERKKKGKRREGKGEKKFKERKAGNSGGGRSRDYEDEEGMWKTVAGENSEVCGLFNCVKSILSFRHCYPV